MDASVLYSDERLIRKSRPGGRLFHGRIQATAFPGRCLIQSSLFVLAISSRQRTFLNHRAHGLIATAAGDRNAGPEAEAPRRLLCHDRDDGGLEHRRQDVHVEVELFHKRFRPPAFGDVEEVPEASVTSEAYSPVRTSL
ncbi:MAG: hypothetical protein LUG50_01705 [Planctomycetaceae bacterium]|nr:hypothetical protein [Planctomycetaceae bacterium]